MNNITIFLNRLRTTPEDIQFADVIALIDAHYDYTPTAFVDSATNQTSENQGSAKVFSFARLHELNKQILCIASLNIFALLTQIRQAMTIKISGNSWPVVVNIALNNISALKSRCTDLI